MRIERDLSNQPNSLFHGRQNVVYVGMIILLGAILRLYDLGTESFWFDEMYTVNRMSQDLQTLLHQLVTQGDMTRNAVYYLLAHFWVMPFEMTEVSIRSLSALFGVLSVGMMYLVGRQLLGGKAGLLSSFFMAVSSFQIQHSQEARFYSLFVLLTLVSVYCYILALKTKSTRSWVISGLINILLFYTHTYAIFVFAVEYVHYLIYWKSNKSTLVQWGMSQVLLVLGIVVGFIPLLKDGSVIGLGAGLAWITVPSVKDLFLTVYGYLFPQNYQHSWFFIGVSFAAGLLFFVVGAFFHNFRKSENRWFVELKSWFRDVHISSELVLVIVWFVCPVLLPFIYSNLFSPIFVDRYTICAAPAFYLLIAAVISRINRVVPIYLSLGALMIVILPGLQDYYVADVNEQWQEVAAYVQGNSQANDVIVFTPDDKGYQNRSFDWYYQGTLPSCGIGSEIRDDQVISDILSDCTLGHDRFWLIMRGPAEVIDRFTLFFLDSDWAGMHLIEEQRFVKVSVYLFELSK